MDISTAIETKITNATGKILARIYTDKRTGDKEIRSFTGQCLGKYRADLDITTTFTGQVVAHGEALAMFIPND